MGVIYTIKLPFKMEVVVLLKIVVSIFFNRYLLNIFFLFVLLSCEPPSIDARINLQEELVCDISFDPQKSETILLQLIRESQESIHIALYGFENENIAKELVAASLRGVEVHCVTEYDSEHQRGWLFVRDAELKDEGAIDLKLANLDGIMHNKYFIIDNQYVVTGSTNLTDGMQYHFNNLIVLRSPPLAADFKLDFDLLYAGFSGKDKGSSLQLSEQNGFNTMYGNGIHWQEQTHLIGNYEVTAYFTPYTAIFPSYSATTPVVYSYYNYESGMSSESNYANAMNIILPLIDAARNSIVIYSFAFTDKVLMDLLIKAAEREVKVDVRIDYSQFRSSYSHSGKSILALADRINSLKLCRKDDGGLLHHKMILIDNEIVVLGSLNFSNSAVSINDENFLVIKNAAVLHDLCLSEGARIEQYSREVNADDLL